MATPLSIKSFYMKGLIKGPRYVHLDMSVIRLFVIPRDHTDIIAKYKELDSPSLYILTGVDNDKPTAYIGYAKSFRNRIIDHMQKKDFWRTAYAFVANDMVSLSSNDVQYLEYRAIEEAQAGNMNIVLDNKNKPHKPAIEEAREATMMSIYEEIKMLAEFAGCNVFTTKEENVIKQQDILFANAKGFTARGTYNSETKELTILKNSEIIPVAVDSYKNKAKRAELIAKHTVKKGDKLILTEDFVFPSPSGASSFALGRPSNGWDDWRNSEGQPLSQLYSD